MIIILASLYQLTLFSLSSEVHRALPHDLPDQPASLPLMTSRLETLDTISDEELNAFNDIDGEEDEDGFIDSVFGQGTQSRIVASVNGACGRKVDH